MAIKLRTSVLALAVLATIGACGGDDDGGSGEPSDPQGAAELEVAAQDFQFSPNELDVDAGQDVTISISNDGSAPHTFTAPDIDADVRLDPGSSEEITFTAPDNGTVDWMCTIHPQMTGTISVGGAAAGNAGSKENSKQNKDGGEADPYDY